MAFLIELGTIDYKTGLALQYELHRLRQLNEVEDTLILLEHLPVITIGRRGTKANLLVSEQELRQKGIALYKTERGGDITYHGPGQLIGYLIFRLVPGTLGVRSFVEKIIGALILTLGELGIEANAKPGLPQPVGVWVKDKKIASIGIAVRQGVSLHGFALNVTRDLSGFQLINPCGLKSEVMTAIELVRTSGGPVNIANLRRAVVKNFETVLGVRFHKNLPRILTSLIKGESSLPIASISS